MGGRLTEPDHPQATVSHESNLESGFLDPLAERGRERLNLRMSRLLHYARRIDERINDWRLGLATCEWHQQIDQSRPDFRGYAPTSYRDWRIIRRHLKADRETSFVDYGCGLGRIAALAAKLPFKRIIGADLDPDLIWRAKKSVRNPRVNFICADATQFDVPLDAGVLFFCNPFVGTILERTLERIRASLKQQPRPLQIVCNLPPVGAFEHEIRQCAWLHIENEIALSDERKCLIFGPSAVGADKRHLDLS